MWLAACAEAPQDESYAPPRTEHGHPDFQGVWFAGFLTPLERPDGVDGLVATPEQAAAIIADVLAQSPTILDPDFEIYGLDNLAEVRGELRTSLVVEPEDGRVPFTEAALKIVAESGRLFAEAFDHPEERPLSERCLGGFGHPPMREVPTVIPIQIVQTRDHVVLVREDVAGLRVVQLGGERPPEAIRSFEGYSLGRWEGDALVIETTHFRDDVKARDHLGRPIVVGSGSKVIERLTRPAADELVYEFTVEDDQYYSTPWRGEYALRPLDAPIYEYACHEANYSMAGILLGGRAEAQRRAAAE